MSVEFLAPEQRVVDSIGIDGRRRDVSAFASWTAPDSSGQLEQLVDPDLESGTIGVCRVVHDVKHGYDTGRTLEYPVESDIYLPPGWPDNVAPHPVVINTAFLTSKSGKTAEFAKSASSTGSLVIVTGEAYGTADNFSGEIMQAGRALREFGTVSLEQKAMDSLAITRAILDELGYQAHDRSIITYGMSRGADLQPLMATHADRYGLDVHAMLMNDPTAGRPLYTPSEAVKTGLWVADELMTLTSQLVRSIVKLDTSGIKTLAQTAESRPSRLAAYIGHSLPGLALGQSILRSGYNIAPDTIVAVQTMESNMIGHVEDFARALGAAAMPDCLVDCRRHGNHLDMMRDSVVGLFQEAIVTLQGATEDGVGKAEVRGKVQDIFKHPKAKPHLSLVA
ncbi:MAG TPA: hypothetical protein VGE34_00860 [Candidatus Saccharimonadales bacterium]